MNWRRIGAIFGGLFVVGAATFIGLYVSVFVQTQPAAVTLRETASHRVNLTLQTVAQVGHGPNPDWVSYYVKDASGHWRHTTFFHLPAHSLVHVTVYQYDTATGLRNPLWGQPRGIVGGTMTVNGKTLRVLDPSLASHTFAIPDMGISVPLEGVADNAPNQCSDAPCTLKTAHTTVTFEFRTGKPGLYRWQCFVPCGAGTILGFGGPMQTLGYMDGEIQVA